MPDQPRQPKRGRGRPPGDTGARDAIVREARAQFARLGYGGTSLRSVGQAAGVDPRLVLHYFGSKRELFLASVELPLDPAVAVEQVFARGVAEAAGRAAELLVAILMEPGSSSAMTGMLRAAASEPEAAVLIRGVIEDRLLLPIAQRIGGDRPELRASLASSQVVGLVAARNVVGIAPLVSATADELRRAIIPVLDHYLRGDWVRGEDGARRNAS